LNVLVDTPVWSAAIRRHPGVKTPEVESLAVLIREGRAGLIGVVRQELLSGLRHVEQFRRIRDQLRAFPDVAVSTTDHELAAEYFNTCHGHGVQGSNTDFLLCAIADRHRIPIFTTDADFEYFRRHLPLKLYRP
jgi:predicted nucleic acid-binding protein